ncbi:hypothetical protein [Streptomyces sp. NBC_01235]|uniref:hypothetical protein n=1 Tax=Streptomyces sp. NBC_01235 TaxID=2903788 RepID=UPI002E0F709E|nr:hypothetical protein OG289_42560 [Streptomyces sp. NBC_01235]
MSSVERRTVGKGAAAAGAAPFSWALSRSAAVADGAAIDTEPHRPVGGAPAGRSGGSDSPRPTATKSPSRAGSPSAEVSAGGAMCRSGPAPAGEAFRWPGSSTADVTRPGAGVFNVRDGRVSPHHAQRQLP